MIRRIINIDSKKCNGCGICAKACHEGAIGMVNGKAQLLRDDYCDGLGDCLPTCPTGAITFIEREALAYDEEAVKANMAAKNANFVCPGSVAKEIDHNDSSSQIYLAESQLRQWPVQIKLVPVKAPYFDNCSLLIAADCTAYAYGDFHNKFIKDNITIIGCPKLDMIDYSQKLTEIISYNSINSITVARMEVPCCGGIEYAVKKAVENSKKDIDINVVTISADGKILK